MIYVETFFGFCLKKYANCLHQYSLFPATQDRLKGASQNRKELILTLVPPKTKTD